MSGKPDVAEAIGRIINELDIDFSRFSLVGWFVSLLSLGSGGGLAYSVCIALVRRNGLDLAAGMAFCLTMIAVTTIVFLALRWSFGVAGFAVTKSENGEESGFYRNRDVLSRMASAGMDMTAVHAISFWYQFDSKDEAEEMRSRTLLESFCDVSLEPSDEASGFDLQICVELVPTLEAITSMEQRFTTIAEQCNGHAVGWGVRQ